MKSNTDLEQPYPRLSSNEPIKHLPSALVPSRTTLSGRYVELVPQDAAKHAVDLYAASHESAEALKTWDYLTYGPWNSVEDYTNVIRTQSATFDTIFYAIRPLDSDHFEGQSSYLDINPQMGVIEIGHIWFGTRLTQTRAGAEAFYLMIRHAMDDLGYRRIHWRCNSLNENSRNAASRLGFKFEGIFYNHMIFKGKNRDTAWYSILDYEWPQVREIFETWLKEDNFDDHGQPKSSLSENMANRKPSVRG